LQPECSAPGEEIEHPRAWDTAAENAEPRLADPVGGGAHAAVGRRTKPAAAEFAGYDPERHSAVRQECQQARLKRARSAELIAFEPKHGVYQRRAQPRHPVGPPEADGAEPRRAVGEKAAKVTVSDA